MSIELTRKQDLVIWRLLITGEEPMMSKLKPALSPAERKPLVEKGLIRLEKRGRAQHIVLDDSAWDWMAKRIQSEDFSVQFPPTATTAIPAFQALLVKLAAYLRSHEIPLAEFLSTFTHQPASLAPADDVTADDLFTKIRSAYNSVSQSSSDFGVRLSALRRQLTTVPAQALEEVLLKMQQQGEASLMPMEDPKEIGPEDEQAAIDLGDGRKRYFVYLKP